MRVSCINKYMFCFHNIRLTLADMRIELMLFSYRDFYTLSVYQNTERNITD